MSSENREEHRNSGNDSSTAESRSHDWIIKECPEDAENSNKEVLEQLKRDYSGERDTEIPVPDAIDEP